MSNTCLIDTGANVHQLGDQKTKVQTKPNFNQNGQI